MSVTELPPPVPNAPVLGGDGHSAPPGPASGVVIERVGDAPAGPQTFSIELPDGAPEPQSAAIPLGPTDPAPTSPSPDVSRGEPTEASDAPPAPPQARAHRPLPSYAVALIGGLALTCLALSVALAVAVQRPTAPPPVVAAPVPVVGASAPPVGAAAPRPPSPEAAPTAFPAAPTPIPVAMLTELEAAGAQPLEVELDRLLGAIQHGFGSRSARLDPTLRSYTYRMASRFEWNPGTFRIAVTAPADDLAEARRALLERLFSDAVAAGRLHIAAGRGPHALSLVTE